MKTHLKPVSFVLIVSLFITSCSFDGFGFMSKLNGENSGGTSTSNGLTGSCKTYLTGWITDDDAVKTVTDSEAPESYDAEDFEFDESEFTIVEIDLDNLESSYLDGAVTVKKKEKIVITNNTSNRLNILLSGESSVGVTLKSKSSDIAVTLSSVSITSASSSEEQALKISMDYTSNCFLLLEGENTLIGDSTGTANALKSDGSLVISGEGSLDIYANTKNGIVSDNTVVINGGTIDIELNAASSAGTGIKSAYGYVQNGGSVSITGLNYTEGCENKGIKVEGINEDEGEIEYGKGKGYVLINGGELTIRTTGKGITASFNPDEDGDTDESTYDPSADIFINNGLITITTLATPRDDSYSGADDGVSPEGIEGKNSVTVNGGKIILNTTDDAVNVSLKTGKITINGGLIYAHSSKNDAVDSNGTITVTGGTLIALGSSVPEGGIDCDYDTNFTYTGGTVIALGGSNNLPSGSGSSGCYLTSGSQEGMRGPGHEATGGGTGSSLSSGDTVVLLSSSGDILYAFTIPDGTVTTNFLLSSSSLEKGGTYCITKDASLESSDYDFASFLHLGTVECTMNSSSSFTVTGTKTSISM